MIFTSGTSEFPISFEVEGNAQWRPHRNPLADHSMFGSCEAWRYMRIGRRPDGHLGAVPTDEWMMFDFATGQDIVFNGDNAREKAERLAVLRNAGKRTRVVDELLSSVMESAVDYEKQSELLRARGDALAF